MNGIIIIALHKQSYACAAYNLALSIKKFNPTLSITLVTDNTHQKCFRSEHYLPFDNFKVMAENDYTNNGRFCPAKAKLSMYKYSEYKETLYIDADTLCFQNLDALFANLKGAAFKSNNVEGYTQWTDAESFKSFFGVETGQTINSSWIYFERNRVFLQAEKFYQKGFDVSKLKQKWGGVVPDELMFNGAIQKLKVDAMTDFPVMFFDNKKDMRTITQITDAYCFMTFYGNVHSTRLSFREFYDRFMFKLCKEKGFNHTFKMGNIVAEKHVNSK